MAKDKTAGNGKKTKSLTDTFSVKTLKKGFDRFTGDLSKSLRGKSRGTRGIDEARRAKGPNK